MSIIGLVSITYIGVGFILSRMFITKMLPELFNEKQETKEDEDIINELYDQFHTVQKKHGHGGMVFLFMLVGMVLWLPIVAKAAISGLNIRKNK